MLSADSGLATVGGAALYGIVRAAQAQYENVPPRINELRIYALVTRHGGEWALPQPPNPAPHLPHCNPTSTPAHTIATTQRTHTAAPSTSCAAAHAVTRALRAPTSVLWVPGRNCGTPGRARL